MSMNAVNLSAAYLRHKPLGTLLNLITFASGIAVIVALLLVDAQLGDEFARNLRGIDLVVGGKGSPMQLILSSVFHLDIPTGNIPLSEAEKLEHNPMVASAIPVALGDNYAGFRIVGTTPTYPEHYLGQLRNGGRYWQKEMEAVLGAEVAESRGLEVGDEFVGSHGLAAGGEEHEESPYVVVGILEPSGSVIDRLVLTDVESVWHVHEHHDLDSHRQDEGEPRREITSLLLTYKTPLAAVTLPREVNRSTSMQAASPAFEIARLTSFMGVGTRVLETFGWFLIGLAGLGIFVALYNAMNERRYDLALMRGFGASPAKLLRLVISESMMLAFSGAVLGVALGHAIVGMAAVWLAHAKHIHISGTVFLPEEAWLLATSVVIAFAAAVLPAIRVYRIDIFRTRVTR
jgi:putative ABC transport system permease protein